MIYDSGIWKIELEEKTEQIRNLIETTDFSFDWYVISNENGWTDSYKFMVELQKYCFYASVITRKFIESDRLSDEMLAGKYSVVAFKKKSAKILTKDNFESIEQEYDMANSMSETLTIEGICNLFIHSFIFSPKLSEYKIDPSGPDDNIENWEIDGLSGLYINTDHSKDKKVYLLGIDQLMKIFTDVYQDDIVHIYQNRITGETKRSRNYSQN
jgi:hypothetical protein